MSAGPPDRQAAAEAAAAAGARPVGAVEEASPFTRTFVWALRRCLDGAAGRRAVETHFADRLGPQGALDMLEKTEAFLASIALHHRRPLQRHMTQCPCLGADEAAMAHLVDAARDGPSTEAYVAAAALVRPTGLAETVETAMRLGRALARIEGEPPCSSRASRRLH